MSVKRILSVVALAGALTVSIGAETPAPAQKAGGCPMMQGSAAGSKDGCCPQMQGGGAGMKGGCCPHMKCDSSMQKQCKGGQHQGWQDLNLTDDQKAKLKVLREQQKSGPKECRPMMMEIHGQIKAELLKAKPDQIVLNKLADQIADQHRQMAKDRTAHLLEVKKILTAEQFEKMLKNDDGPMGGHGGPGEKGCKMGGAGGPHGCKKAGHDSLPGPDAPPPCGAK
jgi:Spy/CpxP family protein refolding chaperone